MNPSARLRRIFVHSVAHVKRYGVSYGQVKEALLAFAVQSYSCALGSRIIVLNAVLLSVPFESVHGHPRPIPRVFGMTLGLILHSRSFSLHRVVIQLGRTVAVVKDFTDVDGVLHRVGRGAGPRLVIDGIVRVLNLHVHHDDLAFEEGDCRTIDLRANVPAL